MLKLIALASATLALQATAITYDCTLTHEVTPNDGETSTVTIQKAKFDPAKGMYVEMAVPMPDGMAVASLHMNKARSTLNVMMGDFCGEHYLDIEIPVQLGEPIYSIYSYGRNPETHNDWRRLILDCVKEK